MAELRLVERRSHSFTLADVIQWVLIGVLLLGTILLWWGVLSALFQSGGFEGIVSWQTMGIGLAVFQSHKLAQVLAGRIPNRRQRQRLRVIRAILNLNISANIVALGFIYAVNPILGRFYFAPQDAINFILFAVTAGGMLAGLRFQPRRLCEPRSLFWLAVTSRVIPQATLIFSAQLALMPAAAILGVLLIGAQRTTVMGLEYRAATQKKQLAARKNLRWTLASDALNVAAALLLFIVWLAVT